MVILVMILEQQKMIIVVIYHQIHVMVIIYQKWILKKLEDDTDALEDIDYDETLLLLIKQIQCGLSHLATPGLFMDCRVAGYEYESGEILKILNDISQLNGQCPSGIDERTINSAKKFKCTFINK